MGDNPKPPKEKTRKNNRLCETRPAGGGKHPRCQIARLGVQSGPMNAQKRPLPSPPSPPLSPPRAPGAVPSPEALARPNPMAGKIRELVERHPARAVEILRRWLGDDGDGH